MDECRGNYVRIGGRWYESVLRCLSHRTACPRLYSLIRLEPVETPDLSKNQARQLKRCDAEDLVAWFGDGASGVMPFSVWPEHQQARYREAVSASGV